MTPMPTAVVDSTARIAALEAFIPKLAEHVASTQRLMEEFSGVSRLLDATGFDTHSMRTYLFTASARLGRFKSLLEEERKNVR